MSLTAIDNPLSLLGSESTDSDKNGKKSANGANNALFASLLQSTGVKHVAYAGSSEEFDQTLDMRDETVAHEAKMGEDQLKYTGLGLDGADAAVIESTRTPRNFGKANAEELGESAKKGAEQQATSQKGDDGSNPDAAISDTAELIALGAPKQESGVDVTRAANAAESRRAADASVLRPQNGNQQALADAAQAKGKPEVTTEELPKSRYATSAPRPANAQAAANLQNSGIQVNKVQEDVISQPTSTLAASTVLAAQTEKSARAPFEAAATLADDMDSESRPPLANAGRPAVRPQATPVTPQPAPQAQAQAPAPAPQPVQPQLPNVASQQAQLATAAARADVGGQTTGQLVSDAVAGGPGTQSSTQATQRPQQAQAPRPARPPIPPQEVTGQVAVQVKKAISQGVDQIRIQLKPAELGRVDVKLEVTEDGRAMAVVSAERAETLDLLQRDASGLRQALQDAGLTTDSNSLSFNLRGEGSRFEQQMAEHGHAPKKEGEQSANKDDDDDGDAAEAALIAEQAAASDGRVNVQI